MVKVNTRWYWAITAARKPGFWGPISTEARAYSQIARMRRKWPQHGPYRIGSVRRDLKGGFIVRQGAPRRAQEGGARSNRPVSQVWDTLTERQKYAALGFAGLAEVYADQYSHWEWSGLPGFVRGALQKSWRAAANGRTRRNSDETEAQWEAEYTKGWDAGIEMLRRDREKAFDWWRRYQDRTGGAGTARESGMSDVISEHWTVSRMNRGPNRRRRARRNPAVTIRTEKVAALIKRRNPELRPLRTHQWLSRAPARRATGYRVEVRPPRHRYFREVYGHDDLDRALAHAVKLARTMPTSTIRVWDFHKMKEVWTGKGPEAKISRWRTKPPKGLAGYEAFMNPTARRKKLEEIAWKAVHQDYKGVKRGVRQIMYLDPRTGATVIRALSRVPLEVLRRIAGYERRTRGNSHRPLKGGRMASMNPRPKIPRGQIEWLVGNLHVWTPDAEVEAEIRKRTAKWTEGQRKEAVKVALRAHHKNQELVRHFRFNRGRSFRVHYTDGTYEDIQAATKFLAQEWAWRHRRGQTVKRVQSIRENPCRGNPCRTRGHRHSSKRVKRSERFWWVWRGRVVRGAWPITARIPKSADGPFSTKREALSRLPKARKGGHAGLSGLMTKREAGRTMRFS